MFHIFFNSLAMSTYLSFFGMFVLVFFSLSFNFTLRSAGTAKSTILQFIFFFFFVYCYKVWSSGRDLVIRIIIYSFEFLTSASTDGLSLGFQWQQVSRTLLCILAMLNNVIVYIISTRPLISQSSGHITNPLVTVAKAPLTIRIIVSSMFHSFFQFQSKVNVLILLFTFFQFWNFSFLLIIIRSGHLAEIKWSVSISKSHRNSCISFFRREDGLCIYHLFVWSNLNFLHISRWIAFPTQSCIVLYSICANLRHSLIIWLIVSSLLPHNLHLLFCWVLFILALMWLVLRLLFIIFLFTSVYIVIILFSSSNSMQFLSSTPYPKANL